MKLRELVITARLYEALRTHLLAQRGREQLAFLLVSPGSTFDRLKLLVREVVPVSGEGFECQTTSSLTPRMAEVVMPLVERCSQERLGLIEAHSHPFDSGDLTSFSSIDTGNMWEKYPFLQSVLRDSPVGALVFGQRAIDGLIWVAGEQCLAPLHRLTVTGWPLLFEPTTFLRRHPILWKEPLPQEPFARQILAFGWGGQELFGRLRVGLVGLGGLGSALLQPLARLGVRDFVLVDPDAVEDSNLNRLAGATVKDAALGIPKVEMAKRALTGIGWPLHVEALQARLTDLDAVERLKTVDVVFGGLDSDGARLGLNALASQYLIPYIDAGVGIQAEANGKITAIGGQVRVVLPDGPCLRCQDVIDLNRATFDLMSPEAQARHRQRGYVEGLDMPAPSVMALNQQVAAAAVDEFIALITGYKPFVPLVVYDLLGRRSTTVSVDRRLECVTCGEGGLRALGDLESLSVSTDKGGTPPPTPTGRGALRGRECRAPHST